MSYFRNYLNLEIERHTALSDAQYLKLILLLRAQNYLLLHSPYAKVFADILVRVFGKGTEYLKRALLRANCMKCLTAEFTGHASVP